MVAGSQSRTGFPHSIPEAVLIALPARPRFGVRACICSGGHECDLWGVL